MKLKTSEFLRICGMTPRALRYYEAKNAISPERDAANAYRYYSQHDLIMLWEARSLNSLGVPIESIQFRRSTSAAENIIESLSQIQLSLDEQITELERRLHTVVSTKNRYEKLSRAPDGVTPYSYQGIYRLYVNDDASTSHPSFDDCIRRWVACLPQTKLTMTVDHTSLTGDPDHALPVRIGLGISKRSATDLALPTRAPVELAPRASGVMCHVALADPLDIRERDLAPLTEYARRQEREFTGDFHARLSHISTDSASPVYHFFMHAALQ